MKKVFGSKKSSMAKDPNVITKIMQVVAARIAKMATPFFRDNKAFCGYGHSVNIVFKKRE